MEGLSLLIFHCGLLILSYCLTKSYSDLTNFHVGLLGYWGDDRFSYFIINFFFAHAFFIPGLICPHFCLLFNN